MSGQQVERILLTRAWVNHEREIWCHPQMLYGDMGGGEMPPCHLWQVGELAMRS